MMADGERPVVSVALKHVHDAGVVDLALAHAHLKLARGRSGVSKVHVLDIGENAVEIDVGVGSLKVMAGVQGDPQSRNGLAQLDGDLRIGGQASRSG